MRVIAGEFRSRKLIAPEGEKTRPTPDRLRESLFSILQPYLDGALFVDLFAGSGSVGIEALSRGAARVFFVETDKAALTALRSNLSALQIGGRAVVMPKKAAAAARTLSGGIVFADPPYEVPQEYERLAHSLSAEAESFTCIIFQHDKRQKIPAAIGGRALSRSIRQGDNVLSFYGFGEP